MEKMIERYNAMTPEQRQAIINDCNGQFTEDFAQRECGKTWGGLSIFTQKVIFRNHGGKQ